MSNELKTAFEITVPQGVLDSHMLVILLIMVLAGVLGGAANYFLADRSGERTTGPQRREWLKYLVFGVVAALTVPLFLNMISSTLLEGARTKPVDFFTFAGFCLIYVVATRRLFENLVQRLLRQVEQVRHEMVQIKQKHDEVSARVEPEVSKPVEPSPAEVLSYNDVEILRSMAETSFVYGNLAAISEATGLHRDFVSQRLNVMKSLGVIETRINDKNVLHWSVSQRGRSILEGILGAPGETKSN